MGKVRLWLLLLPVGLWAQGDPATCPYLRYILFDACGPGTEEGFNEHLVFFTPVDMNINALRISFPIYPNQNGLDNDSPTQWVCYGGCPYSWTCNNARISDMNSNPCGTTYTCPSSGTTIPANSLIIVFTGVPTTLPSLSNLCGAGTVYVLFTNNNQGQGRYLNGPNAFQNRRTRIAFNGFPNCSMTVNYRGNFTEANGNYLLINPAICIGRTEGQNNEVPSNTACHYSGNNGSNGVSLGRDAQNPCALPGLSVLPLLWQEVRVVGGRLRWRALFEGEAERPLTLWHQPEEQGTAYIYRVGLGAKGELPLERAGLYYLTVESADGTRVRSPSVWYEGDARPYIRYEGGRPILERSGEVAELRVWDMSGRLVLSAAAPVEREVLSRLGEHGRGVYGLLLHLRSGEVLQERLVVEP
jgi:hypothetical protein